MVEIGKSSPRSAQVTARSANIAASEMRMCRSGFGRLMRRQGIKKPTQKGRRSPRRLARMQRGRGVFSCGDLLVVRKFWPDVLPVVRAQVLAGNGAIGSALDGYAAVDRHLALPATPLADKHRRNAKAIRKARSGFDRRGVSAQFHSADVSAALKRMSSAARIHFVSGTPSNRPMESVDQIRRARLAMLVADAGGVTALADAINRSASQVSQWLNSSPDSRTQKPRTISNASARYIEQQRGKEFGWMDQPIEAQDQAPTPMNIARALLNTDAPETVEVLRLMRTTDNIGRAIALNHVQLALRAYSEGRKKMNGAR